MLPKPKKPSSTSSSSAGTADARLLQDIENLSRALSLDSNIPKSTPKSLAQPPSKFSQKPKKPSLWATLKSLSSQSRSSSSGRRRFPCRFSLHVHSVDNLPQLLSSSALSVHWKRTTDPQSRALSTREVRALDGAAEFDEVLTFSCSVLAKGPSRYEPEQFLIYVVSKEFPSLDLGRNLVDLTRLLPLSPNELEERGEGRWSTSFGLMGKAKGAILNVSLGFSVLKEGREVAKGGSSSGRRERARSVEDVRVLHEVLPCSRLKSTVSCGVELDSEKSGDEKRVSLVYGEGELEELKGQKGEGEKEHEEVDFSVVEQGVEIAKKDQIAEPELGKLEFGDEKAIEYAGKDEVMVPELEEIEFGDIKQVEATTKDQFCGFNDLETVGEVTQKPELQLEEVFDDVVERHVAEDPIFEDLESALRSLSVLEWEKEVRSTDVELMTPDRMSYSADKSSYKMGQAKGKFLSLDDEAVTSEFLSMLGIDHSPFGISPDSDSESPKARLWKQFKHESLSIGNNIFGIDNGADDEPNWVNGDSADEFDLSLIVQEAETELEKATQAIDSKSRAKMMEDAETEALMREWGLNENAFHSSPTGSQKGFGSPIDLPLEEPLELPPLGEGLGPFVQTKDGGFLRSMSPTLFKNAKNNGSLVMQVSSPVVVPAEMGSGIMEILQKLASVGIEKLSMQAKKLMPLEDVTGKTLQQIAWEAAPALESYERYGQQQSVRTEEEQGVSQISSRRRRKSESSSGGDRSSDAEYVSLGDLAPLAMDKIEALSIEGLRIQSGMSDEEAPSNISPQSIGDLSALEGKGAANRMSLGLEGTGGLQLLDVKDGGDEVDGLMGLSITLDEWMRLDSGIVEEEDISDRTSKILAAHHARPTEMVSGGRKTDKRGGKRSGRRWGLLGNTFTVALMVQLRDPLRNYEAVGAPMLSLIQVERAFVLPKPKMYSAVSEKGNSEEQDDEPETKAKLVTEEEEKKEEEVAAPQFKITEVHVAGITTEPEKRKPWGNPLQQQSGSRWLLATGMGKGNKSKAITKPGDTLWSVSSRVHGDGAKWKEMSTLKPHTRNPNFIFPWKR